MLRVSAGLLLVLVVAAGTGAAQDRTREPEVLTMGAAFPSLKGNFLSGREAVLPDEARGKVALLALGFTYQSRLAVEAWVERFNRTFEGEPKATSFQIPMIGGAGRLARWFIDRGMRSGTPKEMHERVITVYGGTGQWKRRVGFSQPDAAYLVLLDRDGRVRWQHAGQFDEESFGALRSAAKDALGTPGNS